MAVFSNPQQLLSITGINVFVGDMIRHITTVDDQLDRVGLKYAEYIKRDMRSNVARQTSGTGLLESSINVHKIDKGEYLIGPDIPPAYHAHLVEYGVPSRGIAPRPFAQPALDKWEPKFVAACTKIAGDIR